MAYENPTDLVQPASVPPPATTAPTPVPPPATTAPAEAPTKLPEHLIKMPVMQALVAGAPPAVSASIKEFSKKDEAEVFKQHKSLLEKAGFGFYRSLSGEIGVIFNSLHVHPEDIQAADKAGQLQQIAPPFDIVDHAVGKSGIHNPVLKRTSVPGGPAAATPKAPPQLSATLPPGGTPSPMPPVPAAVQKKLATARLSALQPGAPTSGPEPGAGRLLNQILKPVV